MNTIELKPCPFCGAHAVYLEDGGSHGYTPPSVKVICTNTVRKPFDDGPTCFAKTDSEETEAWAQGIGHYTVRYVAFVKVAELWNTRAEI